MTNPFGTASGGGSWIKPAEINGHILIVANVKPLTRRFDQMAGREVDVATFDLLNVTTGEGWQLGVNDSHPGITNKLKDAAGNPSAPPLLFRVGQVASKSGHPAWVFDDLTRDPVGNAQVIAEAAARLAALPVPAVVSPFASATPPVVVPPAPVAAPAIPVPAAPAQPQQDVSALLAALQAQG